MSMCKAHSPVRGTEQAHNIYFPYAHLPLFGLYSWVTWLLKGSPWDPLFWKIELNRSLQWVDKDGALVLHCTVYQSTAVCVDALGY